jgi:hypothetical protein
MTTFHEYLSERIEHGGFTTEDALAAFLPLVRQVIAAHEAGLCAPLEGIKKLKVDEGRIGFDEQDRCPPRNNLSRVRKLLRPEAKAVDVVHRATVVRHVDDGLDEVRTRAEAEPSSKLERPKWLRGYICW